MRGERVSGSLCRWDSDENLLLNPSNQNILIPDLPRFLMALQGGNAVPSSDVQRKLTAILCTDVVGYSRLMGDDPEGTLQTLTEYRAVFSDKIQGYKGRVVNAPGDSLLADFGSVLEAVSCAVDIQRELAERNQDRTDERRMDFRIGINLGDVLVKDGDIYGDGVNVASRLESLAEPGGICISGSVHEQVRKRLPLHFGDLGEQQVKNIAEPVRAYLVLTKPGDAAHRVAQAKQQTAKKGSALPERPSIAVLPFDNLSADPNQAFFADGLVEDILTSLSAVSSMTVIARNSTFAYKGKAVDVRQVAKDLGVRYVVEGSVRQGGNRLRITAQLIDSSDGSHLWAEKYDRVVEDIFDIQDEITKEIVTALRVNLSDSEQALLLNRGTNNVQAWNHCVQAMEHCNKWTPADHAKARELAEQATNLDPDYALAWALLANIHWWGARGAFDEDAESGLARAAELTAKAIALDETNPLALAMSMLLQLPLGNFDESLAAGKRLISLYPGSADLRAWYALALVQCGQRQEGLAMVKDAMRLNPRHPTWYQVLLAGALDFSGHPEEALEALEGPLAQQPDFFAAVVFRTGILAREGREKEAKEAMTDLRRINPNFRLAHVQGYFMSRDQEYVAAFSEALRKAGLPE